MLVVETIAKIRRAFFGQGKAICRELGLSRKVVRKVIRSGATEFHYEREHQPLPTIRPWRERLDAMLPANAVTGQGPSGAASGLVEVGCAPSNLIARTHSYPFVRNRRHERCPLRHPLTMWSGAYGVSLFGFNRQEPER